MAAEIQHTRPLSRDNESGWQMVTSDEDGSIRISFNGHTVMRATATWLGDCDDAGATVVLDATLGHEDAYRRLVAMTNVRGNIVVVDGVMV